MDSNDKPQVLEFPRFCDPRGNLSFIQNMDQAPFEIKRVEWLYDLPADTALPSRRFRRKRQLLLPLAGSFDARVTSPEGVESVFHLSRAYRGVYVPATWTVDINNIAGNTVIAILSSTIDDPDEPDTF
ncbi:MAG: FdtA/QdtA family cupin domain-containing protein [Muribaculaceae bacterium]|nr:FdtA/QdtA family cupin domain-containing protein [Muribaculaceae bacterium]